MYSLQVLVDGQETDRVSCEREVVRIGRDQSLDVWLPDPTLSKHHATIQVEGTAYVLHDHSTNGTFVNDQKVTHRVLNDGDRIRLGSYTLRFEHAVPLWQRIRSVPRPRGQNAAVDHGLGLTYAHDPAREREVRERCASVHAQLAFEGRALAPVMVDRDVFLVGKGEGCHLRLNAAEAPRVAAVLVRGQSGWQLVPVAEDVTVSKAVLRERIWLKNGDRIGVGEFSLVFQATGGVPQG